MFELNYEQKRKLNLFYNPIDNKELLNLCISYHDFQEYQKSGLGYVISDKENLIFSGATAYSICDTGIEVQILTAEKYRRNGLALVVGARLILECINKNKYPNWSAENIKSKMLAEKLGYKEEKLYTTYIVCKK